MTLTTTQKTIIRLMREGYNLCGNILYNRKKPLCKKRLRNKDFKYLLSKGLIYDNPEDPRFDFFTLTEKGRTVNID